MEANQREPFRLLTLMKVAALDFIKINLPVLAATAIIQMQRLFNFPAGARFRINQSQFYFFIQNSNEKFSPELYPGIALSAWKTGRCCNLEEKLRQPVSFKPPFGSLKVMRCLNYLFHFKDDFWTRLGDLQQVRNLKYKKSIMHLRAQLLELRFVSTARYIILQARTLHFRSTESTLGTMKISKRLNWLAIMNTGTTIQFFIKLLMIHAKQTSGLQIQNKTIVFLFKALSEYSPHFHQIQHRIATRLQNWSSGSALSRQGQIASSSRFLSRIFSSTLVLTFRSFAVCFIKTNPAHEFEAKRVLNIARFQFLTISDTVTRKRSQLLDYPKIFLSFQVGFRRHKFLSLEKNKKNWGKKLTKRRTNINLTDSLRGA